MPEIDQWVAELEEKLHPRNPLHRPMRHIIGSLDGVPEPKVGNWELTVPEWWLKKRKEGALEKEVTQEARAERYRTAWIITTIALILVVVFWLVVRGVFR